jgi:hypothetical protein
MSFKVDDWVLHGNDLYQIIDVNDEGRVRVNVKFLEDAWLCESRFQYWQPQLGEWCWQVKRDTTGIVEYNLVKFIFDMNEFDNKFTYKYEPFIGQLPSFVKD